MAKKTESLTIEQAADSIINWAFSDSRVRLDRIVLFDMLRDDYEVSGRFPTEKECELLVTGTDDGDIPRELEEEFPATNDFLCAFMT